MAQRATRALGAPWCRKGVALKQPAAWPSRAPAAAPLPPTPFAPDARRESAVTTYDGPLLYKEQLQANQDTSYVLRVPNSGGCVIDGKLLADEIRANPANPTCDGRYYPEAGSEWMCRGTGSMCNDPRDAKLYNARITFRRPQGANKALCDLAPMRAVLVATRDLRPGEEIYFNYRSEKPFEHFKKEMQQREVLRKRNKELREVVTYVWQPDAADPACLD